MRLICKLLCFGGFFCGGVCESGGLGEILVANFSCLVEGFEYLGVGLGFAVADADGDLLFGLGVFYVLLVFCLEGGELCGKLIYIANVYGDFFGESRGILVVFRVKLFINNNTEIFKLCV